MRITCYSGQFLLFLSFGLLFCIESGISQNFDPVYTGVTLTPYVKKPYNDFRSSLLPSQRTYSVQDIRVQLEVISERFSKVMTWQAGSKDVTYIQNVTYYNNSDAEVYIAEIAATINLERNSRDLTIMQGVWMQNEPQLSTEVHLAIECAEKANEIFRGTVEGLVFSRSSSLSGLPDAQILQYMEVIKKSSIGEHVQVGVWLNCENEFGNLDGDMWQGENIKSFKVVVRKLDFIICETIPDDVIKTGGAAIAFYSVGRWLLHFRKIIRRTKPRLEVMGLIKWNSEGRNKWQTVEQLKIYWESANKWATDNKYPVWFIEAFDNPDVTDSHTGWWKVPDGLKTDIEGGYLEKILTLGTTSNQAPSMSTYVIVCSIVGVLVLLILMSLIVVLLIYVKKLRQQLSDKDIRDFMEGSSEEAVVSQNEHGFVIAGQKYPYDKSFEIKKKSLKIKHNKILGMGQFGCVFKATIEKDPETVTTVALKIAKDESSRGALKALLSEIKLLIYIGPHPNIVMFFGAYTRELKNGVVYIATELCSLGSLEGYLRNNDIYSQSTQQYTNEYRSGNYANTRAIGDSESISLYQLLKWSQDIARGMEYLGTKSVIHGDLATRNVLLNVAKTAKISDFGLSRRMYDYTNYVKTTQEPLPWRWMAIESLNKCEFSAKSDIWSYGVTLWEIFSMGNTPYPGLTWTTNFVNLLVDGMRLERPNYASPQLYDIMVQCWHPEPAERPSFSRLHEIIKNIIVKYKETDVTMPDSRRK